MKHLYLMRHGETLFNVRHKIQGWCDSPLTEKGIKQAEAAREILKDIKFDHYYSSTAERASDTLEIIIGDKPYTRLKGLKERYFGLFEGESEDLNPKHPDEFSYDDLFPHYGGEYRDEVMKRTYDTLKAVMEKEDHYCVLAVAHAGSCSSFVSNFMDRMKIRKNGRFGNCFIIHLTYEKEKFEFVELFTPDID